MKIPQRLVQFIEPLRTLASSRFAEHYGDLVPLLPPAKGKHVNTVSPGVVPTPGFDLMGVTKEQVQAFVDSQVTNIPLGRVQTYCARGSPGSKTAEPGASGR